MKLFKRLTVGGTEYPVVDEKIILELSGYGRAEIAVRSDDFLPNGALLYELGDRNGFLETFRGWISRQERTAPGRIELICREFAAGLEHPAKISLRHTTAGKLLQKIEAISGLSFVAPPRDYMDRRIPYFVNMSSARAAIENFDLFGVTRGIWCQIPGGQIYWGNWDDSPFAKRPPVPLDARIATKKNPADRSFSLPTIPALRPGMAIGEGLLIERLEITGVKTRVRWSRL